MEEQQLSFIETHCAIDGDEITELHNSQKETCKSCNKVFHYPECWLQHKKETGHHNI